MIVDQLLVVRQMGFLLNSRSGGATLEMMELRRLLALIFVILPLGCGHSATKEATPPVQNTVKTGQKAIDFIVAAAKGNLNDMKALYAEGVDVDASNPAGVTALMVASFRGYDPVVDFLLNHHASATLVDHEQTGSLQYALLGKNSAIVRALIKAHAPLDIRNQYGLTPLMMAARFSTADIVQAVVGAGANIEIKDGSGWTAIFFAIPRGEPAILNVFLNAKANVDLIDEDGDSLLAIAAEYRQTEMAKILLATQRMKIDSVNKSGESSLFTAVREKAFGVMEMLCKNGANVNLGRVDGRTPLYQAIDMRDQKGARFLYKSGATLTPKDAEGLDGREYLLKKDLKVSWLTGK